MSTAKLITTTFPKRVIRVSPNPKYNCGVFLLLQPRDPERPWGQGERFTLQFRDKSEIEAEVIDAWGPDTIMGFSSGLMALCSGLSDYGEAYQLYHSYYTRKGYDLDQVRFMMLICKRH